MDEWTVWYNYGDCETSHGSEVEMRIWLSYNRNKVHHIENTLTGQWLA